jgi:hypothetical protein
MTITLPKRNSNKEFVFEDYPNFRPNLSPREIFKMGSFGGTYFRKIYSSVTKKHYKNIHKKYPTSWWDGIPDDWLTRDWEDYDKSINKYGVKVGTTLEFWEKKHWITKSSPYGWTAWYCSFYLGKRCSDDERQIKRWEQTAGPDSRFRIWLVRQIIQRKKKYNDYDISPAIRQTLQHWAYKLSKKDFDRITNL